MRKVGYVAASLGLCALAFGASKPLATVSKYAGKFGWIKLDRLPVEAVKSLANAKTILIDITFPKAVKVKKDSNGNQWFTLVVADQGGDWKWNQTKAAVVIKLNGGVINAGTQTLSLSLDGIPKSVLADKNQVVSLGPNTSGLANPISFTVDRVRGR